jgi:hypothetical protein
VISGYSQCSFINFYHSQFVINFWQLTLNSFWAARTGLAQADDNIEDEDKDWAHGRDLLRNLAILCRYCYLSHISRGRQFARAANGTHGRVVVASLVMTSLILILYGCGKPVSAS